MIKFYVKLIYNQNYGIKVNNCFNNTVGPRYSDTRFSRHFAYDVSFSKTRFSAYDFNVNKLWILYHYIIFNSRYPDGLGKLTIFRTCWILVFTWDIRNFINSTLLFLKIFNLFPLFIFLTRKWSNISRAKWFGAGTKPISL